MPAYYNDNDAKACAWLRELIRVGLIAAGDVDDRGIEDVRASDLAGYEQCHFFAGIGGWSYALRLAGWPDGRSVWTGSCPCQPFSAAGRGKGTDDPRHLWPQFRRLVEECGPSVVFGEQVASKAGRSWLTGVRADLEALGYGVGAADLCAAGVGAPHIRQRLFWLADASCSWRRLESECEGNEQWRTHARGEGETSGLADATNRRRSRQGGTFGLERDGTDSWHGVYIPCADGKARRIEPSIEPLVDGLPGRVGLLRGYGNSICPQVAQVFIEAYLETSPH
jgi:DNA (cytosine-5)-methyltransferase 1